MDNVILCDNNCYYNSKDYINNNMEVRFFIKNEDEKNLNLFDKNEDFKLHYNVLPQPFFGNISSPEILFLAKNPSYVKYEDEQDTYMYLKEHENSLSKYLKDLELVNFLKPWSNKENICFTNTWNWWNKKIIGNAKLIDEEKSIGYINICAYHSKYFDKKHYEQLPNNFDIKTAIDSAKIIIVLWFGIKLILGNLLENAEQDQGKKIIYLNQNKTDKNDSDKKYGVHINSIGDILNNKNNCGKLYSKDIDVLRNYFK